MTTGNVLADVGLERVRQDEKWGPIQTGLIDGTGPGFYLPSSGVAVPQQKFTVWRDYIRDLTDRAHEAGRSRWSDILLEEVFEALSESDRELLRNELIQVAAVCVKWVEHIDREEQS